MTPRSLLVCTVALLLASGPLSACSSDEQRSIQVAVVWTGTERDNFSAVVQKFEDETGIGVDLVSTGDDIDGFLQARARANSLPDVAVLSRPGLIRSYADNGWLEALDPDLAGRYAPLWGRLGLGGDGRLYGAWIKGSYKSLFWYRPDDTATPVSPSADWHTFEDVVRSISDTSSTAALAIGAADGWVLTDWFENLLIAYSAAADDGVYDDLVEGEPRWCEASVETALTDLASLWQAAFAGNGERAFLTQFDESVIQVVATDEAAIVQGSEFVQALTGDVLATGNPPSSAGQLGSFAFPSPTEVRPVLLGGDAAVVTDGSGLGQALVEWFVEDDEAFTPWIEAGGYFSPIRDARGNYPEGSEQHAQVVANPESNEARFDLSDQVSGTVAGKIGPELQALFASATFTSSPDLDDAVQRARDRLNTLAGGDRCPEGGA